MKTGWNQSIVGRGCALVLTAFMVAAPIGCAAKRTSAAVAPQASPAQPPANQDDPDSPQTPGEQAVAAGVDVVTFPVRALKHLLLTVTRLSEDREASR
jgi:hypothetical protein